MASKYQHNSGAYGISGEFLWPLKETIQVKPSVDLPPTGGYAADRHDNFNFHEMVSFRRAFTEVSGSPNVEMLNGTPTPAENTLSLSVVEDFNLLQVLEVKKMVSRITARYFEGASEVEIVFVGTRFEGLRILGREVVVHLASDLFLKCPTLPSLRESYAAGHEFKDRYHALSNNQPVPASDTASAHLTLVETIDVRHPSPEFTVDRNVITIPHVGKLYLAELTVSRYSKRLNLLRWELGCPNGGNGTIGGGQGGGSPPSA
jgi:hypothetical protein